MINPFSQIKVAMVYTYTLVTDIQEK